MCKRFKTILAVMFCVILLCGCTKTLTYSFNVSTGSSVDVTLTTDKDYSLSAAGSTIVLTQNEDTIVTGNWYQRSLYEAATNSLGEQGITEQELDGNPCWYFTDTDNGNAACIILLDTNTCLLFESESLSLSGLVPVMQMLTFNVN